jgi:hypothetical protein
MYVCMNVNINVYVYIYIYIYIYRVHQPSIVDIICTCINIVCMIVSIHKHLKRYSHIHIYEHIYLYTLECLCIHLFYIGLIKLPL